MRKSDFITGSYYHVYNRGVDHRRLFQSEEDFQRFYESLYLFNNEKYQHVNGDPQLRTYLLSGYETLEHERNPFVSILSFCLMPNHYHLFVRQNIDEGISKFMHRLRMGYSKYFNQKYERSGSLYEGTFKAIPVQKEPYFSHLSRYIHLNALDITDLNWRDKSISDWGKVIALLDAYKWSSHHVFEGRGQILPVVDEEIRNNAFGSVSDYENFLMSWLGMHCLPFDHLYTDSN